MYKVSVIIPVYGVEKYIERCARSLFEQTLDDIEYIFVDDKSPDGSIDILHKVLSDYPNRINQVKILHHEDNKGLPFARQTGIKAASGEYLAHCDSDDWVDLNLYETMYNTAVNQNADIVVCNCYDTDGNVNLSERVGGYRHDIHNCIDDMLHGKMWWSLCNKLIRRVIYHQSIDYPEDGMGEDMCTTLQLFLYCKSIVYCPDVHYYYYVNESSIMHYLTEEKCLSNFYQISRNVNKVINMYRKKQLVDVYQKGLSYIAFKTKNNLLPILGKKEYYKIWKFSYHRVEFRIVLNRKVSIKERTLALLSIIGIFPIPRDKYSYLLKNSNESF